MAVTVLPLRAAMGDGLAMTPSFNGLEASTQTYNIGAPLKFSSGYMVECTSGAGVTGVIGLAEQSGANNTLHPSVRYIPALPHVVFEGLLDATTSNSPAGTHALAVTDIGAQYGLQKDTGSNGTNNWYVNFSDTTNKVVVVVGLKDAVATTPGRVYFKFLLTTTVTIYA